MNYSIGVLFVVIALAWIAQLSLSIMQTKRFHARVAELRRDGYLTSVGLAGSNWRRKVYGVLVVDENQTIVRAEKLSGFTVFTDLKPVRELTGMSLDRLNRERPKDVPKKVWESFRNAANYILSRDDKAGS